MLVFLLMSDSPQPGLSPYVIILITSFVTHVLGRALSLLALQNSV